MNYNVSSLPVTGTGSAAFATAGSIGLTHGWVALTAFGFGVAGLAILHMGRLQVNSWKLRREGRLDD